MKPCRIRQTNEKAILLIDTNKVGVLCLVMLEDGTLKVIHKDDLEILEDESVDTISK